MALVVHMNEAAIHTVVDLDRAGWEGRGRGRGGGGVAGRHQGLNVVFIT